MFNLSDVQQDVTEHFGVVGSSLSRRLRGRTTYRMARGKTPEADYLIPASTSACYQSGITYAGNVQSASAAGTVIASGDCLTGTGHRYGSTDTIEPHQNDGITIIKQQRLNTAKDYSTNYVGAPKTGGTFFHSSTVADSSSTSSSNRNDKSTSDNSTTTNTQSSKSDTYTGLALAGGGMSSLMTQSTGQMGIIKKSDSTASDWLSTPTDEMLGIDVKGLENDRINIKRDPRV